jgi:hypothetical protein
MKESIPGDLEGRDRAAVDIKSHTMKNNSNMPEGCGAEVSGT